MLLPPRSPATEAVHTIEPPPAAAIGSTTARRPRKTPRRFTATTRSQTSTSPPRIVERSAIPAFRCAASRRPKRESVSRTIASFGSGSETSTPKAKASPPRSPISFATRDAPSASRSATQTRAPCAAKSSAVARPIPDAAPVTSTTRPRCHASVMLSSILARPEDNRLAYPRPDPPGPGGRSRAREPEAPARRDRRGGLLGPVHGLRAPPRRARPLHDLREVRRRRRDLARQQLPGRRLRLAGLRLLLLLRAEDRLVAQMGAAAGDPGLSRGLRARLRPPPAAASRHRDRGRSLRRAARALAAPHHRGRGVLRRGARLGSRAAQSPPGAAHPGARSLSRHLVPLRALGPRLRDRGPERRGDRERGERDPADPGARQAGGAA